jgi:hypothetical protein
MNAVGRRRVFNHRNSRRPRSQFSSVNPFGNRDRPRVYVLSTISTPTTIDIHVQNASPASQAVGPP